MSSPKRLPLLLMAIGVLVGCLPVRMAEAEGQERTAKAKRDPHEYNVRAFGVQGDGQTLDTVAINRAIEAAAASGGGTVRFPAGNYLSFSIHLKNNIALYLDHGQQSSPLIRRKCPSD